MHLYIKQTTSNESLGLSMVSIPFIGNKDDPKPVPSALEAVCPPPDPQMTFGMMGLIHFQMYPWAQSESCNIVNIQMIAQASMSTVVQQEVDSAQSNTMYIKTPGNVTIVDSTIGLSNNYSVKSVQAAFVSNAAQQQLMLTVMQHASAVVKGMNVIPSNSSAGNVINAHMKATINMCTTVQNGCSQSQSNALVVDAGGDITIQDSYLSESNSATQTCVQATVDKNVSMQSLSAQIAQIATAATIGISVWELFLVVLAFIAAVTLDGAALLYSHWAPALFTIMIGAILTIYGAVIVKDAFEPTQNTISWYGCSPGIPNSSPSCAAMYRPGPVIVYSNPDTAIGVLGNKKNTNLAAFDWVWNDDSVGGTATWYEYATPASEPNSVFAQNCSAIFSPDQDDSKNVISIRPDAYLNVALNAQVPSITIIADLIVDCDTGNIWVRMPPGFNTCNPSSYGGQDTDEQWVFVSPKTINMTNVDNVYNSVTGCSNCSSRCCKSGCVEAALITPAPGAKVYIYIDPTRILDYNINADYQFGQGTYQYFMHSATTGLPGTYLWDMTSPVGNQIYEAKITADDYFLVVFPWGPKASSTFFGTQTFGEWPVDATEFEPYDFAQAFALYKAVKDPASGKFVPYVGTVPPKPDNWIPGLGPNFDIQAFQSTCVKAKIKPPKVQQYYSVSILVLGLCLLLAGMVLAYWLKDALPTPESSEVSPDSPKSPSDLSEVPPGSPNVSPDSPATLGQSADTPKSTGLYPG